MDKVNINMPHNIFSDVLNLVYLWYKSKLFSFITPLDSEQGRTIEYILYFKVIFPAFLPPCHSLIMKVVSLYRALLTREL